MKFSKILLPIFAVFVFFEIIISFFKVFPEVCPLCISEFCHVVFRHLKREDVDPEIGLTFLKRFMDNRVNLFYSAVGHCITSDRNTIAVNHDEASGIAV